MSEILRLVEKRIDVAVRLSEIRQRRREIIYETLLEHLESFPDDATVSASSLRDAVAHIRKGLAAVPPALGGESDGI